MEFEYTNENQQVLQMVKEFVRKEVSPHIKYYEKNQLFPKDIFEKMGNLGFFWCLFS
ncbi:acyl-CoA dehydrogenase family protein [Cytobacillus kochii]|uniref:Acyl-CoA dehydrogenase/oxidase N-terminal domain-containing protein n=1 Tax=Cytobacillus kochii TaxID=859143 RepID=A0A248TNU0_9BACI|nr:acyl-CoA dehydrogenase family protein [Cytobacillus kochii]ASV69805.1 hypothetical protein CKF48_22345 [Cytobacillus kochii]